MRQNLNIYRLMGVQILVVLATSLLWSSAGMSASVAALFGGVACIIPTALFANRFFNKLSSTDPKRIVLSFYMGETTKILISVVLLVLLAWKAKLELLPLFVGFISAQVGSWFAPLFAIKKPEVVSE